jgi:hypothetical protein
MSDLTFKKSSMFESYSLLFLCSELQWIDNPFQLSFKALIFTFTNGWFNFTVLKKDTKAAFSKGWIPLQTKI